MNNSSIKEEAMLRLLSIVDFKNDYQKHSKPYQIMIASDGHNYIFRALHEQIFSCYS